MSLVASNLDAVKLMTCQEPVLELGQVDRVANLAHYSKASLLEGLLLSSCIQQ